MNKNYFSLSVLLSVLFCVSFLSCSKEYSSPLKGQSVGDLIFETGTNSKTITIGNGDLSKCTISCIANWCSVSIQGASVVINVQPNDTYEQRQAYVTITDTEDPASISFKVIQNQNDAIIVTNNTYSIRPRGGSVRIKVQSNVDFSVEIPSTASWLTNSTSSTRGLNSSTITLSASQNNSGEDREAIVTLKDSKSETTTQLTIKQSFEPIITFDKEEYVIDELGGEVEVTVNSNVELNTTFDDSWVSNGGKKELEGYNFVQKIKVSPLPKNMSSRTTTITFTDKLQKWNTSEKISIRQQLSLSLEESSLDLFVGDSYSLTLYNYTDQSVSWKSSNTSVVTVNNNGKVTAVGKGSATITVTTSDGKHSIKINVSVKVALYISTRDISINIGDTYSLVLYNNTGQSVSWKSSNKSVAKVDSNGKVTAVASGSAIITVQTADGKYSDKIDVTVGELEINNYITATTNAGITSIVTSSGAFSGYFVSSTLKNSSTRSVTVNKCTIYENGSYLGTETGLGTMKGGSTKSVMVKNASINITANSYVFVWEYSYNGKTYTYNSKYK